MSEADLLRRAATLMRERAEAAAPGPWAQPVANVFRVIAPEAPHTNPRIGKTPPYPWRVVVEAGDSRHAEDTAAADATHIAAWHPAVALAVADWLNEAADETEGIERLYAEHFDKPRPEWARRTAARAVARAYLGEEAYA